MSLLPLVADAVRAAMADAEAERDLYDKAEASGDLERLVYDPVDPSDLMWLRPGEWRWYASWRQNRGGPLDQTLVGYLALEASSPESRFHLRSLTMRDEVSVEIAGSYLAFQRVPDRPPDEGRGSLGLDHLEAQAEAAIVRRQSAEELVNDALQIATSASWFTLRLVAQSQGQVGLEARSRLASFAESRGLSQVARSRWFGFD